MPSSPIDLQTSKCGDKTSSTSSRQRMAAPPGRRLGYRISSQGTSRDLARAKGLGLRQSAARPEFGTAARAANNRHLLGDRTCTQLQDDTTKELTSLSKFDFHTLTTNGKCSERSRNSHQLPQNLYWQNRSPLDLLKVGHDRSAVSQLKQCRHLTGFIASNHQAHRKKDAANMESFQHQTNCGCLTF